MDVVQILRKHGIQPTAQRVAVARYALSSQAHPSADEVWEQVRRRCPMLSRATVYNTLHLLAEKGLLQTQVLKEGTLLFDPNVEPHHHFIDEETGQVHDVPWDALKVSGQKQLQGFDVTRYQVVLRGRKRST